MTRLVVVTLAMLAALTARPATAQLTDPCRTACALTLGASSFVFATGTMTAVGRLHGGYSTRRGAIAAWSVGFVAAGVAGVALQGNGERQRDAVYGSALGAAGGAALGLVAGSLVGEATATTRWVGTLIGAAVGVVAGGFVGAAGHAEVRETATALTLVSPPIPVSFGF